MTVDEYKKRVHCLKAAVDSREENFVNEEEKTDLVSVFVKMLEGRLHSTVEEEIDFLVDEILSKLRRGHETSTH